MTDYEQRAAQAEERYEQSEAEVSRLRKALQRRTNQLREAQAELSRFTSQLCDGCGFKDVEP